MKRSPLTRRTPLRPKAGLGPAKVRENAGERKPRKELDRGSGPKSKPKRKDPMQAAYEAAAPADEAARVLATLNDFAPPEWVRFWGLNKDATDLWSEQEIHHVHHRRYGHAGWNLLRAFKGCHKFFHGHSAYLRAFGLLIKDAKGEYPHADVFRRCGKNPVAFLEIDLKAGAFNRCPRLKDAVRRLVAKYPDVPERSV